jgi:hypothetical protein
MSKTALCKGVAEPLQAASIEFRRAERRRHARLRDPKSAIPKHRFSFSERDRFRERKMRFFTK